MPQPRSARFAQAAVEAIAAIYEGKLWRRSWFVQFLQRISFEKEYDLVTGALNLQADTVVLDVGCGTGIYTRPLAGRVPRGFAVGIDRSVPMLHQALQLLEREPAKNLCFVRADGEQLPIASRSADAVVCCGVLHMFPSADRAVREIHRVLRPGGRLSISTFRRRPGELSARVARVRKAWSGMDAFLPEQLEAMLQSAGFSDVNCHHAKGVWLIMSATKHRAGEAPALSR